MKLKYRFAIQKLGKDYAAVAIGPDAAKFNGMLRFNETGKALMEALAEEHSPAELLSALQQRFEGDTADMEREIAKFCAQLREAGLLTGN